MNIIVAAIRKKKPWRVKLDLFEQHGNNPLLVATFHRLGPTYANVAKLDAELNLLRWRKGLPQEPTTVAAPTADSISPAEPQEEAQGESLYPKGIETAIRIRAKAINAREKAGRKLTQFAHELSQEERAALVKEQKAQHAIVAEKTRFIHYWKEHGRMLKPGELTEREQLEREWELLKNGMPSFRKKVRDAVSEEAKAKAAEGLAKKEQRYEELREILGKQKRRKRK